jgi:hypothetical protein
MRIRAIAAIGFSSALLFSGVAVSAHAAPEILQLTSQQLTDSGFPKKPTTGAGGSATLSTNTAAVWQDITIRGQAPTGSKPGQLLTLYRYYPTTTSGDGEIKSLNITTPVGPQGNYSLHFQLGYPGTYGYALGYETAGPTPETLEFTFQITTTGTATNPPAPRDTAVVLTSRQLTKAGFTRTPNVNGWGGTANLSASRVKAGAPVTISGTAPAEIKPGSLLNLARFVATDKKGSGHMSPLNIVTRVNSDQTYSLTFEINEVGVYGYNLYQFVGEETITVEFQLRTT